MDKKEAMFGVERVHVSALVACGLSGVALAACLIAVPILFNEISSAWTELDDHMRDFKVSHFACKSNFFLGLRMRMPNILAFTV